MGNRFGEGLAGLISYLRKHPKEATIGFLKRVPGMLEMYPGYLLLFMQNTIVADVIRQQPYIAILSEFLFLDGFLRTIFGSGLEQMLFQHDTKYKNSNEQIA